MINIIKKITPNYILNTYHYGISLLSAVYNMFPSRKIKIIGVTGTKGKSTTTEIINAILEEAGYKTALSNTIRYKVGNESTPNKYKMSMPGRFFVQNLISKAVKANCDYLVLEMTSQGVLNYRHKWIELDALVFTNLSPEHIEAHGSYENYRDAKLELAKLVSRSSKRPRTIVVNEDDVVSDKFLAFDAENKVKFGIKNNIDTPLLGEFNKYNVSAAFTLCTTLGISEEVARKAISNFKEVLGRVQFIDVGQDFKVVVDYAHTTDSLKKLYDAFPNTRKICILGGTGGGRDRVKRNEMGKIADQYCGEIILTNEDPYDEDPNVIVNDVASGVTMKKPKIIMDRKMAITEAVKSAKTNDVILITGKGTDPYIMGPNGSKIPWSDAEISREILLNTNRV
jgi:UDP-N-acetylmuramoyl-L-alanyl-D-glutamate--2,6-diaminopimelate ligase